MFFKIELLKNNHFNKLNLNLPLDLGLLETHQENQ